MAGQSLYLVHAIDILDEHRLDVVRALFEAGQFSTILNGYLKPVNVSAEDRLRVVLTKKHRVGLSAMVNE